MNKQVTSTKEIVELLIRMSILILLFFYCFEILLPFIMPVLWAMIIAVAVFPIHDSLQKKLGKREKLSAAIITLAILSFIFIPTGFFISSISQTIIDFKNQAEAGAIHLDQPNPIIQTWPIIGKPLYDFLQNASGSLTTVFQKYQPEILTAAKTVMLGIVGSGLTFFQVIFSIIISGVLLSTKGTVEATHKIFERIAGKKGPEFVTLTASTIRSVVKGVLGVAVIQALLAGAGFFLASVPHAGIWGLVALILSIIQVGPGLVIIPVIIYLFTTGNSLFAGLWTAYFVVVMFSDNILKPLLLGKGAQVPMLVIFLGVLGGFFLSGFIGLFTGAIMLSIGYKLFLVWMHDQIEEE
ncbi:MAG: AI-2E family transporter [Bacteroidota bacterium]